MKKETEDWERKGDKRRKSDTREQELEELELEQEEEGYDRETEPAGTPFQKGTVAAVFCCLIVLAAILCGILWYLTHGERGGGSDPKGGRGSSLTEESQESGSDGSDASQSDPSSQASPESGGNQEPGSGGTQEPGSGGTDASQGSQSGQSSQASPESGGTQEPGSGGTDASQGSQSGQSSQASPGSGGTQEPGSGGNQEPESGSSPSREPDHASAAADPNRVSTLDGRVIVFTDCDDIVTPKIYVNLRTEPSTSEGDSTVLEQISAGTWVHRTGISEDSGWSRIEKDGTVCYVVTSYIVLVGVEPE